MLIESTADLIAVIAIGSSAIAYVMLLVHFICGFLKAPLWERRQALVGIFVGGTLGTVLKIYLDGG